jgi:uncharacterized protein YlaN (UPF0358 family)
LVSVFEFYGLTKAINCLLPYKIASENSHKQLFYSLLNELSEIHDEPREIGGE